MPVSHQDILKQAQLLYSAFITAQGVVSRNDRQEVADFKQQLADAMEKFLMEGDDDESAEMDEITLTIVRGFASIIDLVGMGTRGKKVIDWDRLYADLRKVIPQIEIAQRMAQDTQSEYTEDYWRAFSSLLPKPGRSDLDLNQ